MGEVLNKGEAKVYAGALVDGEGTIRVTRQLSGHHARYYPDVTVYNSERSLLLFLQERYAGDIREIARKNRAKNKQMYEWRVRRAEAKEFLRQIKPYLIAKRPQAKLVLACPLGRQGRNTTPSEYAKMQELHRKITVLNQRGRRVEQLRMELKTEGQLSLPIDLNG